MCLKHNSRRNKMNLYFSLIFRLHQLLRYHSMLSKQDGRWNWENGMQRNVIMSDFFGFRIVSRDCFLRTGLALHRCHDLTRKHCLLFVPSI